MNFIGRLSKQKLEATGVEQSAYHSRTKCVIASERLHQPSSSSIQSHGDMLSSNTQNTQDNMVFQRSQFPHQESPSLHVSALPMESKDDRFCTYGMRNTWTCGSFESRDRDNVPTMKRPYPAETESSSTDPKKKRFDSIYQEREEISQSDFEMAVIKKCIANKDRRIYNGLLQNFGILPSPDTKLAGDYQRESVIRRNNSGHEELHTYDSRANAYAISTSTGRTPQNNMFLNGHSIKPEGKPYTDNNWNYQRFSTIGFGKKGPYLKEFPEDTKVFDDEGNCYIDSNDFDSFYRPKKGHTVKIVEVESPAGPSQSRGSVASVSSSKHKEYLVPTPVEMDISEDRDLPKRGLNFTFHGANGGYAVDHNCMPRVVAIHSIPVHGRLMNRRHVVAEMSGSVYKPATEKGKVSKVENSGWVASNAKCEVASRTTSSTNWWPPSPDSLPDEVIPQEHGGLLKIMTQEDRAACGLTSEEENPTKQEPIIKEESKDDNDDDDVIVTKVTQPRRPQRTSAPACSNVQFAQQLSSDATGINMKDLLVQVLALRAQRQQQNSSADKKPRRFTMKELCQKLNYTRTRLENEQLRWKRKLLASLEAVLIKKILNVQRETGESLPEGLSLEEIRARVGSRGQKESLGGGIGDSNSHLFTVVESLTNDDETPSRTCTKRNQRSSTSVSEIRGYASS